MKLSTGGQPTFDDVYDRIVQEYLETFPVDEGFTDTALKSFRQGPTKVCSKSIGKWLAKKLIDLEITQRQLADWIGVNEAVVAEWVAGGDITLGHLVLVLIELECDFTELPLPVRKELATEGYLMVVSHVRAHCDRGGGAEPLDRERFWCLFHLFSKPHWARAVRRRDAGLLREEAERILAEAGAALGQRPRRITGVEDLKHLVSEWMIPWVVCLAILPRNWTVQ